MNALPEGLVDKRIQQAIDFAVGSDTSLKYACIAASPIVGTYSHGTAQIAKAKKRSVSTVENWAHAHWLYKALRKPSPAMAQFQSARFLWRVLPASHWWLAYDIQQAGYNAVYYLNNAYANNWSGREMMQEYKADREAGNAPMQFQRVKIAFRGMAQELKDNPNLTPAQAAAVDAVTEAFE